MTVIVVVHNAGAHLARCLAALEAQTFGGFEAIVCDNASTDGAFAAARGASTDPRLRFVPMGGNLGFAAANNRAAAAARGTWLALLNPDAIPAPDWLERLLAATKRHADVDAFASLQLDAADPARLDGAGDALSAWGIPWRGGFGQRLQPFREAECFSACAAAALYRTERFRALDGFAEAFFCFCEDVDFGFRLRLAGGKSVLVPDAIVRHWGGASAGRRSDFAVYHGARNRLWLLLRCMPMPLLAVMLTPHVAATLALLAAAALRGRAPAFLRGLRDACAGLPQRWAERRHIQAARRVPAGAIAAALVWSPLKAIRRAPALWSPREPAPRI
ncbi:glycosyltransferase family 2 protein [Desertibaculum subflavum]|uniref:glycosyltransferase family 2 protein n=1 Tax=Desertibaculum subflavum TaxID=2268458 RepID=UPI0034D30571